MAHFACRPELLPDVDLSGQVSSGGVCGLQGAINHRDTVLSVDYLPQLRDQLKDDRSVDDRSICTHSQGME